MSRRENLNLPTIGWRRAATLALGLALATGCAVGPNYKRPAVDVPQATRGQAGEAEKASLADQAWWEIFHDEALQSLIRESLEKNYDLRIAAWRVEQARSLAGVAKSEWFPEIQASAGWSRSRISQQFDPSGEARSLYDANIGLSWELDLWGRIRRLNESARANYLSSVEARRGVLLSLVSEVASSYFQLLQLDQRLEIAQRTQSSLRDTRDLFKRRYEFGTASALETASAEASLSATSAIIPDLERQIAEQENLIALLLGRNPGPVARGIKLNDQPLPPEVPPGLPSDLLERRPDIREAEQDLVSANALVGVSVANFFPRISLTGAFGGIAPQVGDLFSDGKTWSFGAGLLTPVFKGKRLNEEHKAALAFWEQAKARYEKSVTAAFGETATALNAYQKLAEAEKEQVQSVASQNEAVKLSNDRYRAGLADYLEVLQAEQARLLADNVLAAIRLGRLDSMVGLYKALGGGWSLSDRDWVHEAELAPARSGDAKP